MANASRDTPAASVLVPLENAPRNSTPVGDYNLEHRLIRIECQDMQEDLG